MKLAKAFMTHHNGKESILVPSGAASWSGVVKGNRTFGAILEQLKEETDEQAIVDALLKRFDAPEAIVAQDVKTALSELRKIGALEE